MMLVFVFFLVMLLLFLFVCRMAIVRVMMMFVMLFVAHCRWQRTVAAKRNFKKTTTQLFTQIGVNFELFVVHTAFARAPIRRAFHQHSGVRLDSHAIHVATMLSITA